MDTLREKIFLNNLWASEIYHHGRYGNDKRIFGKNEKYLLLDIQALKGVGLLFCYIIWRKFMDIQEIQARVLIFMILPILNQFLKNLF